MAVVTRADLEASLAAVRAEVRVPAHGLFGPGSTVWRLGGELDVFLGGGRAALLQLAHPKVARAIADHSRTRSDVAGRFQRTFQHVFAMVFGDLEAACVAARRVHAIHTRIVGALPEAIGAWRAGEPYAANDPETLRWVHATLVDTVLVVRERTRGALPTHVKDAFVREHARFAALFGIPAALRPDSYAAHASYVAQMLADGRLAVAPGARELATFLLGRGDGRRQPIAGRVVEAITAEWLPSHLARAFGLRPQPALARVALGVAGPGGRVVPAALRAIPERADAEARIAGRGPGRLAAWTRARLQGLAARSAGGPADHSAPSPPSPPSSASPSR